ncbi:zinc finger and BTB domain-containing protein 40 isoform X1 [Rhincodon typus]|uniref:zinc finger and BTB domain-containing protein 40 isoform X1 n=1 Tax=Rhincodon typus TaxID=259920 RepID=UPI002030634B|nr:zinc finger and BTB domain-containing protein 40 isoform X1 [Rhincodon typus]XP_048471246.1 zinc finger and BTB domain-containing protein 40 isoform X1 [Rhincodon typus]XP_048471247.1 zinc finger and BTB domain-containing protein 40 isoform X1 [Rhincodon typus]
MELPNYSRQLMQQLYTLRKEEQFCDCTLLIGNTPFRAHKLVLAASSLLFKSLLDNTDTISIDQTVVCPEEFAVLLEMVYTGKVPPGKHNFTKVVSVADNLQMFDIAVSCKSIVANLMKQTGGNEVQASNPAVGEDTLNLAVTHQHCISQELDSNDVPASSDTEVTGPAEQNLSLEELNCTGIEDFESTGVALSTEETALFADAVDPKQDVEQQESSVESHVAGIQNVSCSSGCTEGEEILHEPPSKKGKLSVTEEPRNLSEQEFLMQHKHDLAQAVQDLHALVDSVVKCEDIPMAEKKIFLDCCKEGESSEVFCKLLDKVTEEKTLQLETLLFVLEQNKEAYPSLQTVLQNLNQNLPIERLVVTGCINREDFLLNLYLHKEEVLQYVTDLSPLLDCLESTEEMVFSEEEKKVIVECCQGQTARGAMAKLLSKVIEERQLSAETALNLLRTMKEAYPMLQSLLNTLAAEPETAAKSESKSPEDYGFDLLKRHQNNIIDAVTDLQPLRNVLSVAEDISDGEKERIEDLIKEKDVVACVSNLMEGVLEKQTLAALTVWKLLIRMKEGVPKLQALLDKLHGEPESFRIILSVSDEERKAVDILKSHRRLITDTIDDISPLLDCLMPGVENLPAETIEILKSCCYRETTSQSLETILGKILEEKLIPALTFCRLLHMISESYPSLESITKAMEHAGLMAETGSDIYEDQKEDVQNEEEKPEDAEYLEVSGHDRDGGSGCEPFSDQKKVKPKSGTKQIFTCSACGKSFTFKCRLELHLTRCRSIGHLKAINCKEGDKIQTSQKDEEKHRFETHSAPKGKKRRFPVTCDICGKSFAHQSGMQYHKRSDHFDEKPFSCSECGAKFAANSTLKNHMRLHTGEKPFFCKHCEMTFMQAAALAYHMKKKHSEGKMYGCQYCDAVFAQSIELTRHVRTHTGDKPYVCRECGKGFSQANGLSMHLRSFHNVEDPYDCQKCRMSFPTLEEHKKHIQDVHPPEYNPCDICGKNFSAPSLLERHMVTHIGGKPYNCDICDKAYQQLSGLWYHNRTHHPDIFAAQNHRSPKFATLLCSACEKSFGSTASLNKHMRSDHSDIKMLECENCKDTFATQALLHIHVKSKHSGIHPFKCSYCSSTFRFPGALHHHLSTEHLTQQTSSFVCGDCAQLFNSQQDLEEHQRSKHAGILFAHVQEAAEMVIQASEQMSATEQVISLEETHLNSVGSQVFVALPNSQNSSSGPHEIVALNVNDLLDGSVTLICGETP